MRSQTQPHGKFYKVISKSQASQDGAASAAYLPKYARGHMVMVLSWAEQWDWVKVVTVTSSAASTSEYIDYLPIYPSKKNQRSGIQLRLCNDWVGWTYMQKKSYVKMDEEYSLPLERLRAALGANGLQYELQSKSWHKVQRFLREGEDHQAQQGADRPYTIHSSVQENRPGIPSEDVMERVQRVSIKANSSGNIYSEQSHSHNE
ncbi:MAG: hypothetical protein Q9171_003350 [Xanthocarpia ochracea]